MSVQFKKIQDLQPVAKYISGQISKHLEVGDKVLWLVTGGSSIKVAVAVSKRLKDWPRLDKLTVMMTDERYGEAGHPNSNWQQLIEAGFFLPEAKLLPILLNADSSKTTKAFADNLDKQLADNGYKIGLFGMGPDGHTSGILPESQALGSSKLVEYYQGPDHLRITTTEKAIVKLDEAVLFTMGIERRPVIEMLLKDTSIAKQPAQILKRVGKLTVFNDQIGEQL